VSVSPSLKVFNAVTNRARRDRNKSRPSPKTTPGTQRFRRDCKKLASLLSIEQIRVSRCTDRSSRDSHRDVLCSSKSCKLYDDAVSYRISPRSQRLQLKAGFPNSPHQLWGNLQTSVLARRGSLHGPVRPNPLTPSHYRQGSGSGRGRLAFSDVGRYPTKSAHRYFRCILSLQHQSTLHNLS